MSNEKIPLKHLKNTDKVKQLLNENNSIFKILRSHNNQNVSYYKEKIRKNMLQLDELLKVKPDFTNFESDSNDAKVDDQKTTDQPSETLGIDQKPSEPTLKDTQTHSGASSSSSFNQDQQ